MIWTITGSRPPSRGRYTRDELHGRILMPGCLIAPGDTVITGGCIGVDEAYMEYAYKLGAKVVTLLPIKRDYTAVEAVRRWSHEVVETGLGYWPRDRLEVERCHSVMAFPLRARARSSPYSGTWHTWDCALQAGKAYLLVVTQPRAGETPAELVMGEVAAHWMDTFAQQPVMDL